MNQRSIDLNTTIVRSPEQISGTIDAQAVLMSIDNGKYYGLSPMGTHIWSRLDTPVQVNRLISELLAEFDVEREVCEAEVLAFVSRLHEQHLVSIA